MNGFSLRKKTVDDISSDDLIEYDPSGAEETDRENEIDENEVKTIYIEFIKNYQNSKEGELANSISTHDSESVSCMVKYCKSINILNTELTFFSIPKSIWANATAIAKWTEALQQEGESLSIDFRICEKHFKPEHIQYHRLGKRLSRFAVPCLEMPQKEEMVVPYFSDIDSIEQYIKGSAESYILDMKSRSMSEEDSLESTSTTNGNSTSHLISIKMEVTEDLRTVVKPVTISSSNSGTVKMFTTPIRRVVNGHKNIQNHSVGVSPKPPESATNIESDPNDTVVIRKLSLAEIRNHKRKRSQDFRSDKNAECDQNGELDLDFCLLRSSCHLEVFY